ncbi:UNVERIFIED_CONTAM: Dynein heavy chain 10, axonemal [Gekko kuhli]
MPGASVPPPSPPPPHSRGDSASSVAGSTAPRKPDKKTKSPQESVAHKAKDKKKPEKSSKTVSDATSGPPEPKRPRKSAPATTPTPTSASAPIRPSDPECTPTDDPRYRRLDRAASDDRRSDVMLVPSRSPSVCSQPPSEIFESDDGRAPAPRDRQEWFQDVEPVMPYYGPRTRTQRPLSQSATRHYFMEYSPEPRSPSPNTYAQHYYASRFQTVAQMVRVWRNECLRVFHDRLINEVDKNLVQGHIKVLVEEHFNDDVEQVMRDPILFGDFRMALNESEPRVYEDIQDYDAAKALFQEILEEYNEMNTKMNLVLFDDALEHLTRIHRIIRMDRGHALLVGGSGKQSLTRLAAYTAGSEIFEIVLSRGYGESNFREDLKALYTKLGLENKMMVFLFTDAHVAEEGFLELINNMLTSGIVPALFPDDERETILSTITSEAMKAGIAPAKESVWQYFVNKSANNLHIVLGMSPVGETLRTRCRNFPGLVNNTGIDWFLPWPAQALYAVAKFFLGGNPLIPPDNTEAVIEHTVMVHDSVGDFSKKFLQKLRRSNYVTPKNFLDFIHTYAKLLEEKNLFILAQCKRLEGGLDKLKEASIQLAELNLKLAEQKIVLAEKSAACEALLAEIATNTAIGKCCLRLSFPRRIRSKAVLHSMWFSLDLLLDSEEKKKLAEEKAIEIEEQNKIIAVEKREAETALEEALPILEAAKLELQKLDKSDVTEIRSFAKPPKQVQTVCECILIMRGYKELNWKTAKGMMSEANFLRSLMEIDFDSITQTQVKSVRGPERRIGGNECNLTYDSWHFI